MAPALLLCNQQRRDRPGVPQRGLCLVGTWRHTRGTRELLRGLQLADLGWGRIRRREAQLHLMELSVLCAGEPLLCLIPVTRPKPGWGPEPGG